LGIRNTGEQTARALADVFGSFEKISKASLEQLQTVMDVGPVVADSIYEWFAKPKNLKLIDKLFATGVKIDPYRKAKGKLDGLSFVVTGTLESMSRQAAKDRVRELGGTASDAISKNTSYLVAGVNPGSKLAVARKLGLSVVGEEEFKKILD
jgi:DNA ligase (NAD+)